MAWTNAGLSGYDVYAVALSPDYNTDRAVLAVANNEAETLVVASVNGSAWNHDIGPAALSPGDSGSPLAHITAAELALLPGFSGDPSSGNYIAYAGIPRYWWRRCLCHIRRSGTR
jgi:hypothetical protein